MRALLDVNVLIALLDTAIEAEPDLAAAWSNRAAVRLETGRIDEATAVILQAAAEMSATTSEVIAGSTETTTAGADESRQDMPVVGSAGSAPQLSPVTANWQQPMLHMQPPLSPPHVGQLQQLTSENPLQELPADMSSWNSQQALNCE